MNEPSQVFFGAVVGAIVGAAAGYLFFTERGRVLRDRIEPAIDDARRELVRFLENSRKSGGVGPTSSVAVAPRLH
ncbi:MAG: hypothetical protein HW394_452 [Acidobacteria bacterium]|nr:hypothetical protein [Acidobacteriota bacterium]